MKIRLLSGSKNAHGNGRKGDIVDWPMSAVQALLDAGLAEPYVEPPKRVRPLRTPRRQGRED